MKRMVLLNKKLGIYLLKNDDILNYKLCEDKECHLQYVA